MIHKAKNLAGIILLAGLALAIPALPSYANDRMAGSPAPVKSKKTTSGNFSRDLAAYDSIGLLKDYADGRLSPDLWQGTEYGAAIELVRGAPADTPYRAINHLVVRLLLSEADASLLTDRPGGDTDDDTYDEDTLLAARINKLVSLGLYQEAAGLYKTLHDATPRFESVARAGFIGLMLNNEIPIACLETKIAVKQFQDVAFWQQSGKICDRILLNKPLEKKASEDDEEAKEPEEKQKDKTAGESKHIEQFLSGDSDSIRPENAEEILALSLLERAVLAGAGKIDFSRIEDETPASLPAPVLGMLLSQKGLNERDRFRYQLEFHRRALKGADALADLYKNVEFEGAEKMENPAGQYSTIQDWKRLPFLYQALQDTDDKDQTLKLLKYALAMTGDYPDSALTPFAGTLEKINPGDLTDDELETALTLMLATNARPLEQWLKEADESFIQKLQKPSFIQKISTLAVIQELSPENKITRILSESGREHIGSDREKIAIIYEKLDTAQKLHNYGTSLGYENKASLTSDVSYVMPSVVLMDRLEKARTKISLGEVVLLSADILHNIKPTDLYAGTLAEVLDGYVAVGLTSEARQVAAEVMSGSKVE